MMDSQELKDWLGNFSNQNVQIWCEDPETATTVGIMSKTYLTYRILMKQMGRDVVGIRHRYSEFESLRTSLKDRYATMGILIPSLPPKNSVTSIVTVRTGDRSFIKERTLGLTMFCESIVVSPWLKNDSQWIAFMKPPVANGVVIANDNGNNLGETRLIAILSTLEIPYKYTMVQRMEDIKEEVLMIEKNVKTLLSQVRVAQNCEKSLTAANEAILNQLSIWLDAERTGVKSLAGRAFDENESILSPPELQTSTLSATITLLKNKYDSLDNNAEYTGLTLATVLEQELAMVESFKELFKVHEEILYSIDALSTKLGKTETSKNANKEALCADLRKNLEEKQTCLSAFYKGFIYFTLPWSARQRALTVRKLSCAISSSYLTSSFALQKHCLTYFESINVNPSSAINETSRMLELLGIKPLEQLPEEFNAIPGQDISVFSGSVDTLYQRAVHIGKGKSGGPHIPGPGAPAQGQYGNTPSTPTSGESTTGNEDRNNVITASVAQSVPIVSEGQKANPLATRRGSAILNKTQSFMDATPDKPHTSSTAASVAAERHSSSLEVEGDDYGVQNIEISNNKTPVKQSQSNPFDDEPTHLPAPLSSKTKSLLDDLMGGGSGNDDEEKIGSANIRESNVWG